MRKFMKKWAAPLLCGLLIFLLFKLVFFVGYVPSASMEPAINAGSCIFGCRIISEIQRGDVLVFEREGAVLVKRVAAVPGDVVYIDDIRLTLSVNEELPGAARVLTVPDGCYFMLGDNADCSIDSRVWENPFIDAAKVVARVRGG